MAHYMYVKYDMRWNSATMTMGELPRARRVHPSTVQTHQPYNPIGLDLELPNEPLKDTPESPRSAAPGASSFRVSPGSSSAALGPAL